MPDTTFKGTARDVIVYLLGQEPSKMYRLEEVKEKRSLSANSYYQVLVDKIAEKMNLPRDEAHRRMLNDYGTWEYNADGSPKWAIFPDNEPLPNDGYYYDTKAKVSVKGTKSGEEMGHAYIVIRGSHTYDPVEMKRLIDGTVQEAQSLDIETRTPQEIELMIQQMKEKE